MSKSTCVFLFVKAPVAGMVKTRLASSIGDKLAAEFAQLQFEVMFKRFIKSMDVESWIAGDINHRAFDVCDEFDAAKRIQKGKSLGDKMEYAMRSGLEKYDQVAIVGSDCLGVGEELLEKVFEELEHADMVFVPAQDGGFVLWASTIFVDNLFADISWGEPSVWPQTQQRLKDLNINYVSLDSTWDIDSMDDIKQYRDELPLELNQFLAKNSIEV